jgi:adenylate cyclase
MTGLFARKLRLRPSIMALFVLLTVPVFFTSVAVTYVSNEGIARDNADALIERSRTDAIDSIQGMFNPIKSLVRSAAMVSSQQPDFYSDNRSLKYLFSMLLHSDKLVSVYVGMADGSFRQARRINPVVEIQSKLPPAGVKYAYRWIESPREATPIDHYFFLDGEHNPLGTSDKATTYDPRTRLWYRQTAKDGELIISDPDIFAALGLIGFTIAAPTYNDGKIAGVAAADITLDGLSQYLSERKISPGTLCYVLDTDDVTVKGRRAKIPIYELMVSAVSLRRVRLQVVFPHPPAHVPGAIPPCEPGWSRNRRQRGSGTCLLLHRLGRAFKPALAGLLTISG